MRRLAVLLALALLSACGAAEEVGTAPDALRAAAYAHDASPSLTLVTVVTSRTGSGAHSALVVDGSQRVVFDPAGTFNHDRVMPERGDVLYGLTPELYRAYLDYHTRETHDTIEQTVPVSPETAEAALGLVQSHGAAPKARCARATSEVLRALPGFEGVPSTWYPRRVSDAFGALPGVRERVHSDDGAGVGADLRAQAL